MQLSEPEYGVEYGVRLGDGKVIRTGIEGPGHSARWLAGVQLRFATREPQPGWTILPDHKPPDPDARIVRRNVVTTYGPWVEEPDGDTPASALPERDAPQPDLPNHPSRPCLDDHPLGYFATPDGDCILCGWPTSHYLPAAEFTGILNRESVRAEVPDGK